MKLRKGRRKEADKVDPSSAKKRSPGKKSRPGLVGKNSGLRSSPLYSEKSWDGTDPTHSMVHRTSKHLYKPSKQNVYNEYAQSLSPIGHNIDADAFASLMHRKASASMDIFNTSETSRKEMRRYQSLPTLSPQRRRSRRPRRRRRRRKRRGRQKGRLPLKDNSYDYARQQAKWRASLRFGKMAGNNGRQGKHRSSNDIYDELLAKYSDKGGERMAYRQDNLTGLLFRQR